MARNIAVIGNCDSVEYFRILGCEVYETEGGELTDEKYREVLEREFRIILVTEEVFHRYREIIQKRSQRTFPVISVIPDIHGAKWVDGKPQPEGVAFAELRDAVIKAVGQDISGVGDKD